MSFEARRNCLLGGVAVTVFTVVYYTNQQPVTNPEAKHSQNKGETTLAQAYDKSAKKTPKRKRPPEKPFRNNGKRSDYFPNIRLVTHENKTVRLYDDLVKDHTVIINFMYTRCTGI